MVGRTVKRLVIALIVLVPVAVLIGGVMYYREEQRINREAAATPQVPSSLQATGPDLDRAQLPRDVNVRTVHILLARDDVTVLDVRGLAEYRAGYIPGAMQIPLNELGKRMDEVPTDGLVVVVCRSGRRSNEAATSLEDAGFDNILHMTGGMQAWTRAGFQVERIH
jgi:rhodanese-related sulfurtransferase